MRNRPASEYFRANLWPEYSGHSAASPADRRPAFMVRLLLAATLGAKYGTYGPVFELGENTRGAPEPRIAGEHVAFHRARQSLPARKPAAARSNPIPRNGQFQSDFLQQDIAGPVERHHNGSGPRLGPCAIRLGNARLPSLGLEPGRTFAAEDVLGGGRYLWQAPRDYVELVPGSLPGHILRVRRWLTTERDFDYSF